MARGRGFGKKKDKWDALPQEWRDGIAGAPNEKLDQEIRDAAMYDAALTEQQKNDQQLKEAKEAAKQAGEVYTQGKKICKLKVAFCRQLKKDRGQKTPGD